MLPAELATAAPGATVDPRRPMRPAWTAARTVLRDVGLGAAVLILLAMAVVVAAVTRMSLDLHQATVDLLRPMGASEDYVGRQFEQHALANALRGGLRGLCRRRPAAARAAVAQLACRPCPACPAPSASADWLLLGCVPVAGALLTAFVARRTARWGLRRLG